MPDQATTENEQAVELAQSQRAGELAAETEPAAEGAKPGAERFISSGEAILLLAFTGSTEIIQWLLDLVPYAGWIVNGGITFVVGFSLIIWLTGKVAKGAPKKWYKAVYYGAVGGALPVIPGFFGSIIYLLMQDRKLLGQTASKLMGKI